MFTGNVTKGFPAELPKRSINDDKCSMLIKSCLYLVGTSLQHCNNVASVLFFSVVGMLAKVDVSHI